MSIAARLQVFLAAEKPLSPEFWQHQGKLSVVPTMDRIVQLVDDVKSATERKPMYPEIAYERAVSILSIIKKWKQDNGFGK